MSNTLEALQKHISSGEDLSSIVRTMKALAATSVRQYEKAAESLDDYYHTVELGLSVVLAGSFEMPAGPAAGKNSLPLLLIFGSDHGLAGRFNEQIVVHGLKKDWLEEKNDGVAGEPFENNIFAIGEQVISRVKAEGIRPARVFNMPTSINAITPFVQLLLEGIEAWRSESGGEKVMLLYNRPLSGTFRPLSEILLPVDLERLRNTRLKWQSRSLPTFTMSEEQLLSALLRQYFFVSLYRACALSLAAENTSRLAAMQAAEKNINERLAGLRTAYQHERQAAITEELLDIISGFKAVQGKS